MKHIRCCFHLLCTEKWIGVYTHRFTCKFSVILLKTLFIAILKVTCLLKCLCRQGNLRTIWISWFLLSISNLKNPDIEMKKFSFSLGSIISQIPFIDVLNIKSWCMISFFMIQTLSISNPRNADIEMRIPFPLESIISQIPFIDVLNIKSGCMISLFMIQTS